MKNTKRIKTIGGLRCPKCNQPMQRFEHAPEWKPKAKQPYFFKLWDRCLRCKHTQHYEWAKVPIRKNNSDKTVVTENLETTVSVSVPSAEEKPPWE